MIEEEDVYKVTIPMEAGVQNEKLEWTKLWDQLGLSKGLSKGLSNEQISLFFESLMSLWQPQSFGLYWVTLTQPNSRIHILFR